MFFSKLSIGKQKNLEFEFRKKYEPYNNKKKCRYSGKSISNKFASF